MTLSALARRPMPFRSADHEVVGKSGGASPGSRSSVAAARSALGMLDDRAQPPADGGRRRADARGEPLDRRTRRRGGYGDRPRQDAVRAKNRCCHRQETDPAFLALGRYAPRADRVEFRSQSQRRGDDVPRPSARNRGRSTCPAPRVVRVFALDGGGAQAKRCEGVQHDGPQVVASSNPR